MNTKQFMNAVEIPASQFIPQVHQPTQVPLHDAVQIKAAEYWLKLGEADLALKEMEALPSRTWEYGWALKTRIAAIGMLREEVPVDAIRHPHFRFHGGTLYRLTFDHHH